ncbi:MAG: hypothetical protein PHI11_07025 [Gallionella sp.]|nr:hypothetical protein [Gallionella sp.]
MKGNIQPLGAVQRHTRIETVNWPDADSLALDDRPVQPEVALL